MLRWSYDIGLIHLVGIDTESNFSVGSSQYHWLERDLSRVNRSVTPWIVVGGHRPMYANSYYNGRVDAIVRIMDLLIKNLEPLFYKYKVDLAFWAHYHSYQRHSAVYQKKLIQRSELSSDGVHIYRDPQATVHVIVGTGGADFSIHDPGVTQDLPYPHGIPGNQWYAWTEQFFYRYGYSRIKVFNDTHLDMTWTDSFDQEIHDHARIIRNEPSGSAEWGSSTENNAQLYPRSGDILGVWIAVINSIILVIVVVFVIHNKSKPTR